MIADAVRVTGKIVHEEVPCTAYVSSDRRIDMLIIDPSSPKKGLILDPTVRWEQNTKDGNVSAEERKPHSQRVDEKKRNYYMACIPDLKKSYGLEEIEIKGLLIGARGTIFKLFEDVRNLLGLPKDLSKRVAVAAIKGSVQILHNHINNANSLP